MNDPQAHEMDRISFTADGIAARRTLMDLPFANDIYQVLFGLVKGTPDEQVLTDALLPEHTSLVPFFEARYRLLSELIKMTGATQILELAAGLSPRGLEWTTNRDVTYVEFDLPKKRAQKEAIVDIITNRFTSHNPQKLFFAEGDVINLIDLEKAVSRFKKTQPIVIANEGLHRYLTHEKKRQLAENIKVLLKMFGGWWITPDINILNDPMTNDPKLQPYIGKMQHQLGDLDNNLFLTIQEARLFFERLGFSVEQHSFTEVHEQLVSPQKIGMSAEDLGKLIGWRTAFVMKLR